MRNINDIADALPAQTRPRSAAPGVLPEGAAESALHHIRTGLVILDPEGRTAMTNQSARDLLGADEGGAEWTDTIWRAGRGSHGAAGREVIIIRGPGDRLFCCSLNPFPWPDGEAGGDGLAVQIEDVTDQVQVGVQRERTQSLTAMGEMASEIAHQIRNPLGGIELFASILAREVEGDPSLGPLVEHVISGVGQVNHLITNYLALASTTRPARKPVSLSLAAGEALGAAAAAMDQAGIAVEVKGGGLGAMVDADPQLLMQVFLNIILNAVEAMESGGKLTVRLKSGRRRAEAVFTDTGPGIAPERLDRIFNPFYTTKNKNLGLGLAVSHRIVDAHNGSIQVGGRPGRGAAVTVSLPLAGGGSWGRGKDGS